MDKFTLSEQIRLEMISKIQEMKNNGYLISEISRILGKDRRTIKRYIQGEPNDLCKHPRKRNNPYENKVINLIENGYIEKQIVDILLSEGYKLSRSNARHMIRKVIRDNNLMINKYSPMNNSIKTKNGAIDTKYTYIKRNYIFNYLWMNAKLSEKEKNYLYVNYPKVFKLKKCIIEFRELFKIKSLVLLYIFIDKYINTDITELASFVNGLLRDIEAIENSVSSDLSNGFVEGTNSKLKMIKRTMYGRCSKKLLAAKLMLAPNG
ncbi:transposase [Clostridium botulinum]|uniref:transposase n=1 Tax=Clostridium TaxID=1485 RepID=UPI0006C34EEE|nr:MULTISPECIES: transposase [Clostridium]KAI3345096.1 transposase [Clostridium botulinum]KOM89578.1 transposase [Clostridium botulinum]KOR57169.1 transposase [Clostridium botulinum]MBN1047706.1 transposase [Clostridium botulinum]MBN1074232.1 transposase [Clostridium botulinum]